MHCHANPESATALTVYLAECVCKFPGVVGDQARAVGIWRQDGKLSVTPLLHLPKRSVKTGPARGDVENLPEVIQHLQLIQGMQGGKPLYVDGGEIAVCQAVAVADVGAHHIVFETPQGPDRPRPWDSRCPLPMRSKFHIDHPT